MFNNMMMNNMMPMNNCMPSNNGIILNNNIMNADNNIGQNDQLGMVYGSGGNIMKGNLGGKNKKINVTFKTTNGLITNLTIDTEKTINDLILIYLKRVDRTNLFKEDSGILFLQNAKKMNIFDKTKIKDFFGDFSQVIIMVNDVKNLIGA